MAVNRAAVYLESNQEEISSKTVHNTRMDLKHIPSYIVPEILILCFRPGQLLHLKRWPAKYVTVHVNVSNSCQVVNFDCWTKMQLKFYYRIIMCVIIIESKVGDAGINLPLVNNVVPSRKI